MNELAVIADVHGDARRLERLLSLPELGDRDLVLLGDYVDRGERSAAVLGLLVDLKRTRGAGLVLLQGNHELALLRYLRDGDLAAFGRFGGLATIRSYVGIARGDVRAQLAAELPADHLQLLMQSMQTHVETDDVLLSHAGYDPARPAARTQQALVEATHPSLFDPATVARTRPRPLVVCGHYVQRSGKPYDVAGFVCIDTGCGTTGGPLTALLLPEHTFVSVA